MKKDESKKKIFVLILHILCALFVMGLAVYVRSESSAFLREEDEELIEVLTDENGLPYLTELDSYYHLRLLRNYLSNGRFGDIVKEDGSQWDLHSFAPEGRSADYQPCIILTSAAAQRITGLSPEETAYYIMAFLSAFSALAAYIIGFRISGIFAAVTAGIAVGCGPQFASRTCFGRYDTDALIIILELCLILACSEAFRAKTKKKRILMIVLFALTALLYSFSWMPKYAILFTGLTLAGGALYILFECLLRRTKAETPVSLFAPVKQELTVLLAMGGAVLISQLSVFGFDLIRGVISAFSFTNEAARGSHAHPNLFASVTELQKTPLFPENVSDLFLGFTGYENLYAVNGVGGLFVFLASIAGLIVLLLNALGRKKINIAEDKRRRASLYAWMIGVWFAACLFLLRYGARFIEHLSIPVGLLAGAMIGILFEYSISLAKKKTGRFQFSGTFLLSFLPALALCLCSILPLVSGADEACYNIWPSVTSASSESMRFIRDHAASEDAIIISWWDMGYFYENESDHPCLWDGGSQDWIRSILVSKALVSTDPNLSKQIFIMLANSGNAGVEKMLEYASEPEAFPLLFEVLVKEKDEAVARLEEYLNISQEKAFELEALLHPKAERETYIIITSFMMDCLGWFEYFGAWDFSGTQPMIRSSVYYKTPQGISLFDTEEGKAYYLNTRRNETIWNLYYSTENTPGFTPVSQFDDGYMLELVFQLEE